MSNYTHPNFRRILSAARDSHPLGPKDHNKRKIVHSSDRKETRLSALTSNSVNLYKNIRQIIPVKFYDNKNHPRFFDAQNDTSTELSWESQHDWRLFRARLVAWEQQQDSDQYSDALRYPSNITEPKDAWAHLIPSAEKGCLLISRIQNSSVFSHSIVLVHEHGQEGSSGLIINMPASGVYVRDFGLERDINDAFGNCLSFIGGDLMHNMLHVVHFRDDVEDSLTLLDGVYAGGIESCTNLVLSGQADASEFRLLSGYTAWAPDELDKEVASGRWWVVSASPTIIRRIIDGTSSCHPMCTRIWADDVRYNNVKERSWVHTLEAVHLMPQ